MLLIGRNQAYQIIQSISNRNKSTFISFDTFFLLVPKYRSATSNKTFAFLNQQIQTENPSNTNLACSLHSTFG